MWRKQKFDNGTTVSSLVLISTLVRYMGEGQQTLGRR